MPGRRNRLRPRAALGACAIGGMLALASCTPATLTSLPDGVVVAVDQNRSDRQARIVEVTVHNDGDADLVVTSARLLVDGLTSTAWSRRVAVPVGLARDLAIPLGERDCAVTAADALVAIDFTTADGRSGSATVAPGDPFGTMPRVATEDCFGDAVAASVTLSFDDTVEVATTPQGIAGMLTLRIVPTSSSEGLELVAVRRTILIRPATDNADAWPVDVTVAPGDAESTVRLDAIPSMCNPHNVGEDSRATVFPAELRLSDGSTGTIWLPLGPNAIDELHAFIDRYCGWD